MKTNAENTKTRLFFNEAIKSLNSWYIETESNNEKKAINEAISKLKDYRKYFSCVDLCRYRFQKEERILVEEKKNSKTKIEHRANEIILYYVRRARREFLAEV
jgi:hypothetical protein